jgi:colicin import membrane protein
MMPHLHIGKEPNFQKIVITSAVLHLLFITLATIPLKTKDREYKSYFVNLVGPPAVQRVTRAPRVKKTVPPKTITKKTRTKEKKAAQMKAPPRKRTAPKKGVSLEPEKSAERLSREIDRLRALKTLSKKKKGKEEALERSKKADEELASAIEGIRKRKQISVSSSAGATGKQTVAASDAYSALIQQQILSEWIHPEFDAYLEAIVSFRIDKEGKVVSHRLEKSSGNKLFDRSAIKAILKASPLPPPPVEEEVEIRFHL